MVRLIDGPHDVNYYKKYHMKSSEHLPSFTGRPPHSLGHNAFCILNQNILASYEERVCHIYYFSSIGAIWNQIYLSEYKKKKKKKNPNNSSVLLKNGVNPAFPNRGQSKLRTFLWRYKTNDVVCLRSTGLSHPIMTFQGAGREQLLPQWCTQCIRGGNGKVIFFHTAIWPCDL